MRTSVKRLVAAAAISLALFCLASCGAPSPSVGSDAVAKTENSVYVFNNLDDGIYAGEVDPDVAAKAQESWVNFAKTGDPSIGDAKWERYNTDARDTMVIKKGKWECVSDPSKTPRELLEKAYGDEPYRVW